MPKQVRDARSARVAMYAIGAVGLIVGLVASRGAPEARGITQRPQTPHEPSAAGRTFQLAAQSSASTARAAPASPAEPTSPLTPSLGHTREQRRRLYEAEQAAVRRCMAERGFDYRPARYRDTENQDDDDGPSGGYGLYDSLVARDDDVADSNDALLETLDGQQRVDWQEALLGDPRPDSERSVTVEAFGRTLRWDPTSCVAVARGAVYGDEHTMRQASLSLEALQQDAHELASNDPTFLAAAEGWRRCMHAAGFLYASPSAAQEALMADYTQGKLTREQLQSRELQVAARDAECARQHGTEQLFDAAVHRAAEEIAAQHPALLATFEALREPSLARAEALLVEDEAI